VYKTGTVTIISRGEMMPVVPFQRVEKAYILPVFTHINRYNNNDSSFYDKHRKKGEKIRQKHGSQK
jgi:hypothetical protein